MQMISRDGEAKRVASTSGHIMLIGNKPVEVPDFMEVAAYQAGCIPFDTSVSAAEQAEEDLIRQQLIYENMKMMVERGGKIDITANGTPNKATLGKLCGVHYVEPVDYDAAWARILAETEEE